MEWYHCKALEISRRGISVKYNPDCCDFSEKGGGGASATFNLKLLLEIKSKLNVHKVYQCCKINGEKLNEVFSSPELKAQVSFSDRL